MPGGWGQALAETGSRYTEPRTADLSAYRAALSAGDGTDLSAVTFGDGASEVPFRETNQLRTLQVHGRFSTAGANAVVTVVRGHLNASGAFVPVDLEEATILAGDYEVSGGGDRFSQPTVPFDTQGWTHWAVLLKSISAGNVDLFAKVV